jgi:two-component system, OmpR family, response regulator
MRFAHGADKGHGRVPTYANHSICDTQVAATLLRNMVSVQRLRVYLVEDSAALLPRLVELLESRGVEIIGHADTAQAAISGIAMACPDVAIVDIALRNGTGFDVLRGLELSKGIRRRPIAVMLTNHTTQPYRAMAKRLGAAYFFDKSREIVAMLRTIASIARTFGLRGAAQST